MKRTSKGFTLVEIMIVVAIIGILIAIAVPGFVKARNTARLNACQENQTKIDGAVQQFILEENYADLAAATTAEAGLGGTQASPGDVTGMDALVGPANYLKAAPACPAGGVYEVLTAEGALGESVECSLASGGATPATPPHDYPSGS
jgi:prepilin-type N-terminal cleavage/methylation domain-containing protein